VVRDTKTLDDELIERSCDISVSAEQSRAQRRSFAYGNTPIAKPDVTREIITRVGADFERIFDSE
jgi:hypothetical protein